MTTLEQALTGATPLEPAATPITPAGTMTTVTRDVPHPVPHHVTLMTRENCHACDEAKADVQRICQDLNIPWTTQDVDSDRELRAEYGDRVPVILIDNEEHGYWKVEEPRFRAALT